MIRNSDSYKKESIIKAQKLRNKNNKFRFSIFLIDFYQKAISPLFPSRCRFYPTCSAYTKEAILRFGFIKGGFLGLKRIVRCNPFFKGGIDYVPDSFSFFGKKEK